jgi:transposase
VVLVAEPVRARRLTEDEGRRLQQIVRRGKHESIRGRRAMLIMASASRTQVPAIARLVQAHEDTVRGVIHAFNERGLAALDPSWAGGRPRRISDADVEYIVATARTRPTKIGRPFTRWSIRKLAQHLAGHADRRVRIGRERLRQILHAHGITFQRTRTWKTSTDPDFDAKLDRIEHVTSHFPTGVSPSTSSDRCRSGPATAPPGHPTGTRTGCRPPTAEPRRPLLPRLLLPRRRHPVGPHPAPQERRQHPGCAQEHPRRPPRRRPHLRHLRQPVGQQDPSHPRLGRRQQRRVVPDPDLRLLGEPHIEAHFGPLRTFVLGNSNHPNHTVLAWEIQAYLRWRDANARHPDILAAQRRERARVRSERRQRWGRHRPKAA